MYKFNEEEVLQTYANGIQLRPLIEEKLDALWKKGISNICFMGIGGTYGSFCRKCSRILGYRK